MQLWYLRAAAFGTAIGTAQEKSLGCLEHRAEVLSTNPACARVRVLGFALALGARGLGQEF